MSAASEARKPVRRAAAKAVREAAPVAAAAVRSAARYADGTPFDDVTYLEAKLILKPEPFTSVQRFRDFARYVRRVARRTDVGFTEDKTLSERPEIREIVFLDTPDFALYNNAFILRRRIAYEDGFPVGDPEIVFKFRHPDRERAAAIDVRPQIAGRFRIKFKAEALPLKDEVGGCRILFSHNCQFGLSQATDDDRTSLATLSRMLPPLTTLKRRGGEQVQLVNEGIVEEVLLHLGVLDFGKGVTAKCDIALWRTRGEHKPLVGEFAFQLKFPRSDDFRDKPRQRCAQFYTALQHEVADWLALGVTKTAMVYRLKGNPPKSHE
ncbi:hypothetical protein AAFN86_19760 [Roseomonas sp. CAU 1739]|uniref:hypothetical protein n=1 Tax=Roseomonas sp. CAU 1739 TaxID=3140364 RepID=UPI00325A63CB